MGLDILHCFVLGLELEKGGLLTLSTWLPSYLKMAHHIHHIAQKKLVATGPLSCDTPPNPGKLRGFERGLCYTGRSHYIKIFLGNFFCNGPVAFRNGILSRIIGQPRAWVIGSESWKRSIARKVSDGVGVDGVGAKFPFFFFFGFLQFPRSRRLRDNRQQLPGNVQKTLKSLETNKKKRRKKKNKEKQKQWRKKKTKISGKRKKAKKKKKRAQKHKQNANTTEKRKKKEIHSNPIYTNPIKNFPNRGDDLVRISIAKLKINSPKYCTLNFWRIFWCNVITSVTSKYSQEFNLLY